MENRKTRQRKALLVLPLLIIPFLTLAFWAGGGGKDSIGDERQDSGLNMELPDPHIKDERGVDKLSFYEESERDSAKFREAVKKDPLFQMALPVDTNLSKYGGTMFNPVPATYKDSNEVRVYQKLAELNHQLNNNPAIQPQATFEPKEVSVDKGDVNRLENLLQNMSKDSNDDPQIGQLNEMMEKILDIQHPQRVQDKIKRESEKNIRESFVVNKQPALASISLMGDVENESQADTGFYGLDPDAWTGSQNSIEAVIDQDQSIVSGAVIKMRLSENIQVAHTLIPKNNFVFGTCSLSEERLKIEVRSIRYGNSILPVNMEVYDMDGLPGIYIPGGITREVAKQSADNGLQAIDITSMDPTLKAQAASAGINAAKSLVSKKAKVVRVYLKEGYKILLKDNNHNL